jgi:hypothetical protein
VIGIAAAHLKQKNVFLTLKIEKKNRSKDREEKKKKKHHRKTYSSES